jgi:hypothetical protein
LSPIKTVPPICQPTFAEVSPDAGSSEKSVKLIPMAGFIFSWANEMLVEKRKHKNKPEVIIFFI